MKKLICFLLVIFAICFDLALADGCFSVIVGKEASANGYVMLAHTEDFSPIQDISLYKIQRNGSYPKGIDIPKLANSNDLQWGQLITAVAVEESSDCFINEYGVTIASDQCPSRENNPELINGGIGKGLRYLVAARAISARDGVRIAGEIVENIGYNAGGRTYVICDSQEGWVFCLIGGKHWLAQRVNNDEVAVIANSFTVRDINLDDSSKFMASDKLIEYSIAKGWYNPQVDTAFNFGKVFADPGVAAASFNVCRQWSGLRHLKEDTVHANWGNLPFSMKPDFKLGVTDLMQIMKDHYENTALDTLPSETSSPHENKFMTICSQITQMSFIAELREDMPKDVGLLYWLCLGKPCTSFYVPIYFGIKDIPDESQEKPGLFSLFSKTKDPLKLFSNYCQYVDSNYTQVGESAAKVLESYNKDMMLERNDIEARVLKLFDKDSLRANEELQAFTLRQMEAACDYVNKVMTEAER